MHTPQTDVSTRYAWVGLDRIALLFETTSTRAYEYLKTLPLFFNDVSFEFADLDGPPVTPIPTFTYEESEGFSMWYDERTDRLTLLAPWSAVPDSNMLRMSLWMLRERVRHREGRIRLHASAVTRDGRAMLLVGASESGKTTTTLELCLRHGYRLCANDMVELTLEQDRVIIVGGDKIVNFRLRSVRQYSSELARFVFGADCSAPDDWGVKRQLHASACGIACEDAQVPVDRMVFLRLDRECSPYVRMLTDRGERRLMRWAKATLFEESCILVRGAGFTPFDSGSEYVPLAIPSLDTPELVAGRVRLLNALFAQARVHYYRGSLESLIALVTDADDPALA